MGRILFWKVAAFEGGGWRKKDNGMERPKVLNKLIIQRETKVKSVKKANIYFSKGSARAHLNYAKERGAFDLTQCLWVQKFSA